MRITINLNEEILARVDEEARRIGTSRGAMLTTWIGEKVRSLDMTQLWMEKLTDQQTIEKMAKMIREQDQELRTIQPGLFDDADDLGGDAG